MLKKLLPLVLLLILLTGCATKQPGPDAEITVNTASQTLTDGVNTYQYQVEDEWISIRCPNGASISKDVNTGKFVASGNTDVWDMNALIQAVEKIYWPDKPVAEPKVDSEPKIGQILCGLILCGIGLRSIICPQTAWRMRTMRWVRDGEPTELAILHFRLLGILSVVLGVIAVIDGF